MTKVIALSDIDENGKENACEFDVLFENAHFVRSSALFCLVRLTRHINNGAKSNEYTDIVQETEKFKIDILKFIESADVILNKTSTVSYRWINYTQLTKLITECCTIILLILRTIEQIKK